MKLISVLLSVPLLAGCMAGERRIDVYPDGERPCINEVRQIDSPSGRYALLCEEPHQYERVLFLMDNASGLRTRILEIERSAAVVWSPDERYFFVNDHYASNASTCRVFRVSNLSCPLDIETVMKRANADDGKYPFINDDKVYIDGINWLSKRRFQITVHGFGELDPNGYRYYGEFDVRKGLCKMTRAALR